jgi:hypothetical protein
MSDATTNLLLPWLLAAQAQKHVTHNEALRRLDGITQLAVLDRDLTAPPASPADGACWIVAAGASGDWSGWDGDVAMWSDGAWLRLPARIGWRAWAIDEGKLLVRTAAGWIALEAGGGGGSTPGSDVDVAVGPAGGTTGLAVAEELLSGLSGAFVESTVVIPNRAVVIGVSSRTVAAITGASSYDCGLAGEAAKFGGSLGVAAGSTNAGVIGPQGFYADTPVRLTANGGSFTGGAVRIAIHYLTVGIPTS